MDNKLIGLVVGLVVGILMIGSLMMPIVTDATTTEKTFTNDNYYITMDKIGADSEHTITWFKETNTKITVDGIDIFPTWESITIVAEDNNLIRCSRTDGTYYLNMVGEDVPTGYGSKNDKSVTVTIEDGTITFTGVTSTDNTYTASSTFTTGYCINPNDDGDYQYIMKTPTSKAYLKGDSEIYGIGYSSIGGVWNNIFSISGTIDDGISVTLVSTPLDPEPTISDETTVYTTVDGYKSLYQFEKETFNATYDGNVIGLTYSFVIVPAEVTAELSEHLSTAEIAIVAVIPILFIVSLLIFAVRFVTRD